MSDRRESQQEEEIVPDRRESQREEEIVPEGGDEGGADVGGAQVEEEANGVATPRREDEIERQRRREGLPGGGEQQGKVRWYKRKIRKAKNLFLSPFSKIKKFYTRRFRSAYYYYGDDPGGCCCRCLRPPPAISPPRFANPNNTNNKNLSPSSYKFIKFMIESNDFSAPQCNVHRGTSTPT